MPTAGVQAFIHGFPYICNAQLRHDWVTKRRDPIGDRTPGLVYDSGGGLTLHLQPEPPGAVEAAEGSSGNWLPTSADSPWFAILRLYRPQPTVLDGTWRCPPLSRTT
jgi:hypothetical protein